MKPTMALKPLVFALAAVMAMAAQANDNDRRGGHHGSKGPTWEQKLSLASGATAYVGGPQDSDYNSVLNQATENTAEVIDSLIGSDGNMGVNVAGGDGNQQANAAALATADESFIFGSADATSYASQNNTDNYAKNRSTQNTAFVTNAGNSGSGNIGLNVTAGNFNQQKNNLAIAVSGGRVATASADADQYSAGLDVDNKADRNYVTTTLTDTTTSSGTFKAKGTGTIEDNDHGGWGHNSRGGRDNDDDKFKFKAVGSFDLSSVTTHQVLTPDGWKNPVVNHANMNNSLNEFSGNGGANVSAGVGNQQSNSLSIAAGCRSCM